MAERRLSKKQKMFVEYYLQTWNATQAAIKAGYSKRSAAVIGSQNLTKVYIAKEIQRRVDEVCMSSDEALKLLSDQARGDFADLAEITTAGFEFNLMEKDEEGNVVINPNTKLVKKIKQKVTTYLSKSKDGDDREVIDTELELYSAQRALELIGKAHGLFIDKVKQEGEIRIIVEEREYKGRTSDIDPEAERD